MSDALRESNVDSTVQSYQIDSALVERWLALPPDQPIEIDIPRVILDQLFHSIQNAHIANLRTNLAIVAFTNRDEEAGEKAIRESVDLSIEGSNAIRRFMTVVMSHASKTPIDGEGRVIDPLAADGR